jgi:hypothetical protein
MRSDDIISIRHLPALCWSAFFRLLVVVLIGRDHDVECESKVASLVYGVRTNIMRVASAGLDLERSLLIFWVLEQ